MKKSETILFYFFMLLIFSACQSERSSLSAPDQWPSVYTIDLNAKSVDFLDQIESISIFGFEETEESLLNSSSLFLNYENGIIVVDEASGSVYKFGNDGAYLSNFNRMGDGPEEYISMQNTVYRDGIIEAYDYSKQRLSSYDLNGNFLKALKLPYRASHAIFNDGHYLLSIEIATKSDSLSHKVAFLDVEGQEFDRALPVYTPSPFPMRTTINDFRMADGRLLYAALLTDSVLVIDGSEVKSFIQFNFGEDWFWTEEIYANKNAMDLLPTANKVWYYEWVLGPERIEMTYSISFNEVRRGYIDRKTGQFFEYKFKAWGGEYPGMRNLKFEEDKLLMVMTPDILDAFINELGEERYQLDALSLETIMDSENPVLVWAKFK